MTRQQIKSLAKEQIRGKVLGTLFRILLIITLITFAVSLVCALIHPALSYIGILLIAPAFNVATCRIYLDLAKGKYPQTKDAFYGFTDYVSVMKTFLLVSLYTFLWSLLFIVPGIIKSYSYSQAMLIVAENPGIGAREAIRRSEMMMEGHKMEAFVLSLSFIGWILLSPLTLCILEIWLIPYMNAAFINFYNSIKPVEAEAAAESTLEAPAEEQNAEC